MSKLKRRVDLGVSSTKSFNYYEEIIASKTKELTPQSCLMVLKYAAEERNKALQGAKRKSTGEFRLGDSYFKRNVSDDLSWFMRVFKRNFDGTLPPEFKCCEMYYAKQRRIFKRLKRVKRNVDQLEGPGKTAYNLPGKYNGLSWVIHCFDSAMAFNKDTPAKVLHSYLW